MNKWAMVFWVLAAVVQSPAETNAAVRLAVVSGTGEAMTAADVLTAQLSGNDKIQLLERDQIEKVYREQGISAANRDDLKLGRILGADGLLLLNVVRTPQVTNLAARLIAIKPGVVLTDGSFPWPLKDSVQWSQAVADGLNAFLPKLSLLAKDAIPISIVNLRAAVSSTDEQETERDLKLLTIQRLSQERQLFVLERQKMQLLSQEKELKSDESTFWDGSYLLDGTVDQNGYSRDTVTINARLTPPKGGAPLSFMVVGSRTNLVEVVNRLATNVTALLKVSSTVAEWNTSDEAAQYFDEAKWALRWGIYPEAQAAADSAWALGKRDLNCALVRVKSYLMAAPPAADCIEQGTFYSSPGQRSNWRADLKKISDNHVAAVFQTNSEEIDYVAVNRLPDSRRIDCALRALELYYEFSQSSPDGEPKILTRGPGWNDWHNSDWYNVGVEDLVAATRVLQVFNCVPNLQKPVAEKLADLRAIARSVARLISESPSVHQSYFVGNRIAVYDELAFTVGEDGGRNPNIFSCEAKWGCFWQETPDDCVALYRKLMSSPTFCYLHEKFWFPSEYDRYRLRLPRLVAWNEEDRERIPTVWHQFIQELDDSSNLLLQLEGKALKLADSDGETAMAESFTNLFESMVENRDILVTNNVDILYLDWQTGSLIERMGGDLASDTKESLRRIYYSEYSPKLDAMEQEYRNKTVSSGRTEEAFEKQVKFLRDNTSYDWVQFNRVFESRDYTKAQAAELLPLLVAYQSNLIARAKDKPAQDRFKAESATNWIDFYVGKPAKEILNPTTPPPRPQVQVQVSKPAAATRVAVTAPVAVKAPDEPATNILLVTRFLKIPVDGLQGNDISGIQIFAERWCEGKLLVGLSYSETVYEFDQQGNWKSTSSKSRVVIALFNPGTGNWDMVYCPEASEFDVIRLNLLHDNHRMVLFQGDLFSSEEGQLQKFDFRQRVWKNLEIPQQSSYDLFVVDGHLLATDANTILEVTDGGNGTRILASTRRRPAESALDQLDTLGFHSSFAGGAPSPPELFSSPDHSICANIENKIFCWNGQDWREVLTLRLSQPPEIFEDTIVFREVPNLGSDDRPTLWIWSKGKSAPELALSDKPRPHPGIINPSFPKADNQNSHPFWRSLDNDYLTSSAMTYFESNLYFFVEHAGVTNVNGHWTATAEDGYHAKLVSLSRDLAEPIVVPLKFDVERGTPPLKSPTERNEPWLAMNPLLSATMMCFSHGKLFLSQRNSPGVWTIPTAEIESAIDTQKKIQIAEQSRLLAVAEQHRQDLLAKYDLNHSGKIDPQEREAALDDPVFIESELDVIDANHNGRLDPEELAYFDANQNRILEPKEQAGIDIAEHLFAERLMKKFDANGDGILDRDEFRNLCQSCGFGRAPGGFPSSLEFSAADEDHDGQVDLKELESFLKQQLRLQLHPRGAAGAVFFRQQMAFPNATADPQRMFKAYVEFYWQHPEGNSGGK